MQGKTGRGVSAVLGIMCVICVIAPGTTLAGTLDQQQPTTGGGGYAISSPSTVGQTFTAGVTGGLDQVDLALGVFVNSPSSPLTVEIRDVSGTFPGFAVLASRSVSLGLSNTFQFVPINFPTPAPVTAGTQYSIVAHSFTLSSAPYSWDYTSPSTYAPGGAATQVGPGAWTASPNDDMAFKTYVTLPSPPVTPTPTGQQAAALKKCKKKHSHHARKKCKKKARKLPV
jgi:hypothetical protein